MKKSPLLIALTVFLLGIVLLIVPTVGAYSPVSERESYPDSVGTVPHDDQAAGAPERLDASLALEAMAVVSPAYGTELVNNYFAKLDLAQVTTPTNLGSQPAIYAADIAVDNSLVYAIVSNLAPDSDLFVTFDLNSPVTLTEIGEISPVTGEEWGGMAVDSNNAVYATSTACSVRSTLYKINPLSGIAEQIGEITDSRCVSAIAVDNSGNLWGVDNTLDKLVKIDKATGASTAVGTNLGFNLNFNQGLDYDKDHGILYLAAFNDGDFQAELRKVMTDTGTSVLVGTLGSGDPNNPLQLGWLGITSTVPSPIPDIAAITLEKTVGTAPNTCGTEKRIFVEAGDTVYYCYTVTNVGNFTLTNHSLVDSALGNIAVGSLTLAPSEIHTVTKTAIIAATTVNSATWTASGSGGSNSTDATDSATVTVIPEYGSAPQKAIPDYDPNNPIVDTIIVTETGELIDLNVYLEIEHPHVGDLVVKLKHAKSNTTVQLVDRPKQQVAGDCNGNDIDNTLDDQATDLIQTDCLSGPEPTQAYVMGASYQPKEPLSRFITHMPFSGTWELTVYDAGELNEGTLVQWALVPTIGVPEIEVAPTSITDRLAPDKSYTHTLSIRNTGTGQLTWDLTDNVTWATVDKTSGPTDAGKTTDLIVTFDSTGLLEGSVHTGTLTITNNDADENPIIVPLTLTVDAIPDISLKKTVGLAAGSCSTIDTVTVGQGTTVYYCYTVTNTGEVTLTQHSLVDSELGPILAEEAITLAPGTSHAITESVSITMTTVNTATWTAYNAGPTDVVTATDSAKVTVLVPDIEVDRTELVSTQAVNIQKALTMTISNVGQLNLSWNITDDAGWATAQTTSGNTSAGNSSEVIVTFDSTRAPGIYTGTLSINSNDPDEPKVDVALMLTVKANPEPDIEIEPTEMEATLVTDETEPQTLTISNVGDADLIWEVTTDVDWATSDVTTDTTTPSHSNDIHVTFNSRDLEPGIYTGTLSIDSNDPDEALVTVPLTLTVEPQIIAEVIVEIPDMILEAGNELSQSVTISNTGDLDFDWEIFSENTTGQRGVAVCSGTLDAFPGTTLAPTSGMTTVGNSSQLIMNTDTTNLAVGKYTGNVCLTITDNAQVIAVPITLIVSEATAVEMAELNASHTGSLSVGLGVAGMMLLLAGGYVVHRRRTSTSN